MFTVELQAEGEIGWQPDEPKELLPSEVPAFVAKMDAMAMEAGEHFGPGSPEQYRAVYEPGGLRQDCPHCGGRLSWGNRAVRRRRFAATERHTAWECRSCGAAGMAIAR